MPLPRTHLRRLTVESLETRAMLATVPFGALPTDTAEYMLGEVRVNVVLLESTGALDPSTEDWTPELIAQTKSKIVTGLNWWVETLAAYYPDAYLNFDIDFTHADTPFQTRYEPINRLSDDNTLYVQEFLTAAGVWKNNVTESIYAYNHAQRVEHGANWSFTIFVANDSHDMLVNAGIGAFAPGSSFSQAFAYPGGRYIVSPAGRPAETFAHEVGHMFWATDEYLNGSSYYERRGYYDTQNVNGLRNAPDDAVHVASLMSSGTSMQQSFATHTLPASTREMIGWRDSDGDGLIDVLDVPLTLSGDGYYDAASGAYRFVGQSRVQTMVNRNPVGPKSDITINQIRVAEYRIDGGAWQVAGTYSTYAAELDLTMPVPAGDHMIELRTRDTVTGATSAIFAAPTNRHTSTAAPGIRGFVFDDMNGDGVWDANERALAGRSVYLVNSQGMPLVGPTVIDPSQYDAGASLSVVAAEVFLSAQGTGILKNSQVRARDAQFGQESGHFFGNTTAANTASATWSSNKQLRIDFLSPVSTMSIDAIGVGASSYARLELYDANNQLLMRVTSGELALGARETLVAQYAGDVAYAIVSGHVGTQVALDHLRVGAEVSAVTDTTGAYALDYLGAGTYFVTAEPLPSWMATAPAAGLQQVSLASSAIAASQNFGHRLESSPWHNTNNRFDVDGNGQVTPLDALLVIIELNSRGARDLRLGSGSGESANLWIDVTGDFNVTPLDILEIIIHLNAHGAGEGAEPLPDNPPEESLEAAAEPLVSDSHDDLATAPAAYGPIALAASDSIYASCDPHFWQWLLEPPTDSTAKRATNSLFENA